MNVRQVIQASSGGFLLKGTEAAAKLELRTPDDLHQLILEKKMKNIKDKTSVAKTVGAMSLLGCALIAPQFALAEEDENKGWIGGLSVGQSIANIDDVSIRRQLANTGLTNVSMDVHDRENAFKIFAGYQFNNYFSLEGGIFNLGRFSYTAFTAPEGTLNGSIKLSGINLDAVLTLPLTKRFSAFGRAGVHYTEAKDSFRSTGAVVGATNQNPEKIDGNYKVGLGLQYDFNDSVGMRGEWEKIRINDAVNNFGDINMYSVGLVVKFSEKKTAERMDTRPAPAPVACIPPKVVIVPAVKTERYCSILDIQFEINREEIQREEKERLAVLGTYMTKYPKTTAVIEGHSDDVGTPELNMKLSKQRAESVVNYLVEGLKIAPNRLTAVGYGETRPIADNSTEEGKRQNRRIDAVIACVSDIEGLKVKPARVTMALEMEFDRNKADVKSEYAGELSRVATYLKDNPTASATVEGHTDNLQATPEMAMKISQLRAQNVVNYLVEKLGVSRQQLATSAFGESRRVAYNTSAEGERENRRVNIIINYSK